MVKQDFPWVDINKSFQLDSFKKVINLLKKKKNDIFVIIGFNSYILTDESYNRYNTIKEEMIKEIENEGVSYILLSDLPPELYADASHPLKDGYKEIAKELYKSNVFSSWYKSLVN